MDTRMLNKLLEMLCLYKLSEALSDRYIAGHLSRVICSQIILFSGFCTEHGGDYSSGVLFRNSKSVETVREFGSQL